jgi:hypothetical protein
MRKDKEPVLIREGLDGFYDLIKNELPSAKKEKLTFRFLGEVEKEWIEKNKREVDNGIVMKTIADRDAPKENLQKWKEILPEMRHMKNEGLVISIIDEEAILLSLIHSNSVVLIRDKAFIRLMKTLFATHYETLEKI